MIFAAFFILRVQTFLERVNVLLCHAVFQTCMKVIRIQCQNIIFKAVIMIEIHFRNDNVAIISASCKTKTQFLRCHRLCQLYHIVTSSVFIPLLQNSLNRSPFSIRVCPVVPEYGCVAVISQLFCLRKGDIVHFIRLVKGKGQSFSFSVIQTAVIPVLHLIIRTKIIICSAQCTVCLSLI